MDADSIWFKLFKSVMACLVSAITGSVLWGLVSAFRIALHDRQHLPIDQHMPGFLEALTNSWLWSETLMLAMIAFIFMLLFAVPLQALIQKLRLTGYLHTLLLAMVLGGGLALWIGYILDTLDFDTEDWDYYHWRFDPKLFGTGILFGVYYGSVAWFIRRPDKDGMLQRKMVPLLQVHNRNAD
ncbi:hypothetical protein PQU94_01245 [Asticcacaulis sp. DXS10W]|uniref:Uncharacterized protein n=1 Tax=Asticcacaulis currens TaxID=2984210 RepID=A0ABT5I9N9_9CAUL|nr:hypothetical protein [Asticcacaulis currens]MDC7692899.1 hypothetical protein [Asticcacaulis currens]